MGDITITRMATKYGLHKKWLPPLDRVGVAVDPYIYEPDASKPAAWIIDIDGTLAHMNGRGPFELHRVDEDHLDQAVASLVRALDVTDDILFLSGRDASCAGKTERWLEDKLGVSFLVTLGRNLFMRSEGDRRKDAVVKLELFREHVAPYYHVLGVLDDRNQVVEMWRRIGLKCLQVAEGDF